MNDILEYLENKRIIFAKVQDLPDYKDTVYDQKIANKPSNLKKYGGHNEITNFLEKDDGKVYGFTQLSYKKHKDGKDKGKIRSIGTIHLEKITGCKKDNALVKLNNCLVIFISDISEVVGYYKNATVYRKYTSNKFSKNFVFDADIKDCMFFPKERRIKIKQKGEISLVYGQSFILYFKDKNFSYVNDLVQKIASYNDLYQELAQPGLSLKERKELKPHLKYEGRISFLDVKKIKDNLGYRCSVCNLSFEETYGDIGESFIELHHLSPYSNLDKDENRELSEEDFAVLCSNCHRMIHRLKKPKHNKEDITTLMRLKK